MADKIEIDGLSFVLTCLACPEQYDVFKDGKQVGYIRIRYGVLTCEYPDVWGELLFKHEWKNGWKGEFNTKKERMMYLKLCANAINEKLTKISEE